PRGGRPTRARRLTGPGFRQAATAGVRRGRRSCAASHGAGVQAGGDGRASHGAGAPPGRGAPRGRGSSRRRQRGVGRGRSCAAGRLARGRGPPPRHPGAAEAAKQRSPKPLTWANAEGEGEGERPARLDGAAARWGGASGGGSGRPGPPMVVIGAATGGLGRPEDGETGGRKPGRGRGAGEVAFIPSEGPRSTTLGNHRGAGRAPGVTTRRYTSFGPPPGCAGRTTPARPVLKIRHIGHGPFLSARRPRPVLGSVSTPCESTGQGRRTPPLAVAAGLNLGPVGRRARVGCPPCPFLCRRRRLEPRPRETPRTIAA